MSLAILFHFLCAQHVSDCAVELPHLSFCSCFAVCWRFGATRHYSKLTAPKLQHTSNQEQYDQCGNSTAQSQAPDDGYIKVRNMLST